MRMEGLAVVAELIDSFEAELIVASLRAEGIPVTLNQDSRRPMLGGGILGPGTHGADTLIEVLVPAERLAEARAVLGSTSRQNGLPAEFQDDVWDGHVSAGSRRRRRIRRWLVLVPLYAMLAGIVLALVIGLLMSRTG